MIREREGGKWPGVGSNALGCGYQRLEKLNGWGTETKDGLGQITVVGQRITVVDKRITVDGQRITVLGKRITVVGQRIGAVVQRITIVGHRIAVFDQRITVFGQRITVVDQRFTVVGQINYRRCCRRLRRRTSSCTWWRDGQQCPSCLATAAGQRWGCTAWRRRRLGRWWRSTVCRTCEWPSPPPAYRDPSAPICWPYRSPCRLQKQSTLSSFVRSFVNHAVNQIFNQSIDRSFNLLIIQSFSHSITWSVIQSVSHSLFIQSNIQSIDRSII